MKTYRLIGLVLVPALALGGALLAYADEGQVAKKPARVPLPTMQTYKGDQCVEPTEEMRRNHMNYILHQRDETVHKGIRTVKHSLKNCIDCHADPKTGSVLGKDGFCESCHSYAAVRIDCFGCHSDKAAPEAMRAASPRSEGTQRRALPRRAIERATRTARSEAP
ncbi:MAG: hypothetical protein A2V92_03635 [Candidatus Muproteobacteria bacterium RBG_16_65_31]|uniref:Uncharacterized protein n=1 Tax=Candidatus Muproteobacteria bacterium RBG_16_65_31 TaxID=1817759 RepID=A0A1F6TEH0_9PROT|nr:MAG: hypothetical protein A2V92_03635 [Candidatus Muproteobacteria bacterium RBG_16_65_31]